MIPRLRAMEELDAIEAVAIGSGSLERADRQRALNRLRDEARSPRRRERFDLSRHKGVLSFMGIGVEWQKN